MTNYRTQMTNHGLPAAQGLYDPRFEHDACGVGCVVNLKGEKSHDVIHKALDILVNLSHRGACGCDEMTGDGAGIMMQLPEKFLRKKCGELGIKLPPGSYEFASGLIFLPRNSIEREECKQMYADIVRAEGQQFLGWRDVPVNNEVLGDIARTAEPFLSQIFIGRGKGITDNRHFDRKLYVIRKQMFNAVWRSNLTEKRFYYTCSLSCQTFVYKGLMLADQIKPFLPDLTDTDIMSGLALVHQRYSTNTFPTWDLAHPFRFLCHNGEINTVRGNANFMNAREVLFKSPLFGDDMHKILPIIAPGASDSAALDNAVELLYHTGRSLPHAMMMLVPEAWQNHDTMSDEKKAFYEYHSTFMEPWDGPASIPFTDGQCVGALLDRNGLRPSRYTVTKDGFVIMASETGVLEIDPANVAMKGRLEPGRMFLVDTEKGRNQGRDCYPQTLPHLVDQQSSQLKRPPGTHDPTRRGNDQLPPAQTDLRLHPRGSENHPDADGQQRHRADRIDGRGHPDRRPLRPASTGVQLLQAVVCPGDQSPARRHPRRVGDLPSGQHRQRTQFV